MPVVNLPFAEGFYESDSLPISAQECVNFYPNYPQSVTLSQKTLFGTAGIEQIATSGEIKQSNRGAHVMTGVPYFVNGDKLYRLNSEFVLELLGDIEGEGRVSMADNGKQLCVLVPGGKGYIFTTDPDDALTEITDADFRANGDPQFVVFIDGYFLFTTNGKKFIISELNDGLSYNALDFGTAEVDPDDIVAPVVFRNQLFIGGSETIEAFQNRPSGADFPFVRTGLVLQKGFDSPFSVIVSNEAFMFIGGGYAEAPAIYACTGNSVEKVSTNAIDSVIAREPNIGDAFSWHYSQRGAFFTGFTLTDNTFVFDTSTGKWHERRSRVVNSRGDVSSIRYRPDSIVEAHGKILCGDVLDGRIGSIDIDVYLEYGERIVRSFATPPFQNNGAPMFVTNLELTMESGVGNEDEPHPKVAASFSKDAKRFFDLRTRSIGKIGEYNVRQIWRRIGRIPRLVVFKFEMSAPVKAVVIQLMAKIK